MRRPVTHRTDGYEWPCTPGEHAVMALEPLEARLHRGASLSNFPPTWRVPVVPPLERCVDADRTVLYLGASEFVEVTVKLCMFEPNVRVKRPRWAVDPDMYFELEAAIIGARRRYDDARAAEAAGVTREQFIRDAALGAAEAERDALAARVAAATDVPWRVPGCQCPADSKPGDRCGSWRVRCDGRLQWLHVHQAKEVPK